MPVGVDLQALSVDTLHLAAPLAGVDSRWTLHGNGLLSADLHEGRLRLAGDRTDGPSGKLSADTRFDLAQRTVDGEITVDEGAGGVTAALLQRPDLAGVSMRLVAKGDAAAGSGELTVSAGDAVSAKGSAQWRPDGAGTAASVRLEASGKELPDAGTITLAAEATMDDKTATLSSSTLTAGPLKLSAAGRYDRVADRLDGTATVQSDAPGALAPRLGGVDLARPQSQRTRRAGQPRQATGRHRDIERQRRRSRGRRARRSPARVRPHHARRQAWASSATGRSCSSR